MRPFNEYLDTARRASSNLGLNLTILVPPAPSGTDPRLLENPKAPLAERMVAPSTQCFARSLMVIARRLCHGNFMSIRINSLPEVQKCVATGIC